LIAVRFHKPPRRLVFDDDAVFDQQIDAILSDGLALMVAGAVGSTNIKRTRRTSNYRALAVRSLTNLRTDPAVLPFIRVIVVDSQALAG
jgi:hypothetical protein